MKNTRIRIGTAGWSIPLAIRDYFPDGGNLLVRYSQVFNAVEINSSFYKPHKRATYERWAEATPPDFQFSVKMFKEITHKKKLEECEALLDKFISEITGLKTKLGPLLIQLPPSLHFDQKIAFSFFSVLRNNFEETVVLEPRHISWGHLEALSLLKEFNVERVIADPVVVPAEVNSTELFTYFRLHGSPKIYSSSYDTKFLKPLATRLNDQSWVIFDNTAIGAATQNALDLKKLGNG